MHSVYSTTTAMCRRCVYTYTKYWQAVALSDGTRRQHATSLLLIRTFLSKRSLFCQGMGGPFPFSRATAPLFAQAKRKKGNLNLCHCSLPLPPLFYHPPPVCLRCEARERRTRSGKTPLLLYLFFALLPPLSAHTRNPPSSVIIRSSIVLALPAGRGEETEGENSFLLPPPAIERKEGGGGGEN